MNSIISKFLSIWLHPAAALEALRKEGEDTSIKSSMLFVVAIGLVSGIVAAIMGLPFPPPDVANGSLPKWIVWFAIPLLPLFSFIGSFIGAFFLWGLIFGVLKGTMPQYKTSYRLLALLAAFSPASTLLSPIPGKVGPLTIGQVLVFIFNLYILTVSIRGIIIVTGTSKIRTWVVGILIFILSILMGRYVATNLPITGPSMTGLGEGMGGTQPYGDITAEDEDALNKELQGLAEKEKAQPAAQNKPTKGAAQ